MWTNSLPPELLNTVHCMDCLEFMRTLPDGCIDLVLTDIPYWECDVENNGIRDKHTKKWEMNLADDVFFDLRELCKEIDRVTNNWWYIFCWIKQISDITKCFSGHTTRLIIREKTNPMPINWKYVYLSRRL